MPSLTYPTARPEDLSDDAQALYRARRDPFGRMDRDPFDPAARKRHVTREEAEAYIPSERVRAAATELERYGLGHLDRDYHQLTTVRVHPLYTVAKGRGPYFAKVYLIPQRVAGNPDPEYGSLLATLVGASYDCLTQNGAWSRWSLQVVHPTATDAEHDRARVADLEVVNPALLLMTGGMQRYGATLTEASLYPFGIEPRHHATGQCEGEVYCRTAHDPHLFVPYLPPARDEVTALAPAIVVVELQPLGTWEAHTDVG